MNSKRCSAADSGSHGALAAPLAWRVSRWPASMPQYAVGHLERVASAKAVLARQAPMVAWPAPATAGWACRRASARAGVRPESCWPPETCSGCRLRNHSLEDVAPEDVAPESVAPENMAAAGDRR